MNQKRITHVIAQNKSVKKTALATIFLFSLATEVTFFLNNTRQTPDESKIVDGVKRSV